LGVVPDGTAEQFADRRIAPAPPRSAPEIVERWHIPGRRCEFEDALVSGKAVVVSSATNMSALMHAGLPRDEYTYAGKLGCKQWLLDENERLSEYIEDRDRRIERGMSDHEGMQGGRHPSLLLLGG
jgi:hypothetical protein